MSRCSRATSPAPATTRCSRPGSGPATASRCSASARKAGTVVAIGVYAEPCQVHMGLVWIKALTLKTGHANVIGHVDRVLGMLSSGALDPSPLVTHHMPLEEAAE